MNNIFGISDKSYDILKDVLKKYSQIDEILVFGSRAKGNYKNGSDIDLVIKGMNCTDKLALDLKVILTMNYQSLIWWISLTIIQ